MMQKKSIPIGVGICALEDGERTFYTQSQWEALEVKPALVMGVYVYDGTHGVIINEHISQNTLWQTSLTLIEGIFTSTDIRKFKNLYNGGEYTAAVLKAVDEGTIEGAPIFEACRAHLFPDGTMPYLITYAESELINSLIPEIRTLRKLIGHSTVLGGRYWLAAQRDTENAFMRIYEGDASYAKKNASDSFRRSILVTKI